MTKDSIFQSVMSTDLMEMLATPLSCLVVQKLCSQVEHDKLEQLVIPISKKEWLGNSREKMMCLVEQHKQRLRVDMFGCLVLKGMGGWM